MGCYLWCSFSVDDIVEDKVKHKYSDIESSDNDSSNEPELGQIDYSVTHFSITENYL